jgi:hypothetical protein
VLVLLDVTVVLREDVGVVVIEELSVDESVLEAEAELVDEADDV